ncbi:MAG: hypothetical protein ACOC35_13405 [Promethearchaeia archaeon]
MERKNLEKVFSIIQQIEKRNKDLVELLSQTPSLSRDEILENIAQHVVNKNLSELGFSPEGSCGPGIQKKEFENSIDQIITNIEQEPSKKVLYLKDFFDLFEDISEQDKNVMLQSFKNIKLADLKEKMLSFSRMLQK